MYSGTSENNGLFKCNDQKQRALLKIALDIYIYISIFGKIINRLPNMLINFHYPKLNQLNLSLKCLLLNSTNNAVMSSQYFNIKKKFKENNSCVLKLMKILFDGILSTHKRKMGKCI